MSMKVLLLNGSPDAKGCIHAALTLAAEVLNAQGIQTEEIQVGNKAIRGCVACNSCAKTGKCVFDDLVNEVAEKLGEADGLVIGSPVYYGVPNGTLISFMQRLLYSNKRDLHMKVGAAVVSCRRGGNSASYETLNQFFGISGMPTVPSTYWNDVHGFTGEDVLRDEEGCQTIRNMASNMAFMIKAIAAEKEKKGLPAPQRDHFTSFFH